jgi:hypothetical protein
MRMHALSERAMVASIEWDVREGFEVLNQRRVLSHQPPEVEHHSTCGRAAHFGSGHDEPDAEIIAGSIRVSYWTKGTIERSIFVAHTDANPTWLLPLVEGSRWKSVAADFALRA